MTIREIGTIEKSEENKKFYDRKGYHMTGETMTCDYNYGESVTYIIFRGSWTRSGSVRDCGDHYIMANPSRYDRIDKKTLEITKDVEDV